jgi:predicted amidohydrolase YtcJ
VVNTPALQQISDEWQYVDRSTGVLLEDAVLGFMKIIKPELSMRTTGTKKMLLNVYSHGVTAVREIVNSQSIQSYQELDKSGELKLRVHGYMIYDDLDEYFEQYPTGFIGSNHFKIVGVKLFLDGSLGAHTAALKKPYSDDPENFGKLLYTDSELKTVFQRIKSFELSVMAHAIGDRAVQQFLDVYRQVFYEQIPDNPRNHSLEHVEVIDDDILYELKKYGIWLSLQPNFAGRWSVPGGLNEHRLGTERLVRCNAYRTILEQGLPVVFGSDSMPLDPLFGIRSAVQHPVRTERITVEQAVGGYVHSCWDLLKNSEHFGSITPDKIADLVILSGDIFDVEKLNEVSVAGTIINGELVYSKGLNIN